MTDETCFVCEEGNGLVRPCRCATFVHPKCLENVVRRVPSHATHCPICRTPYHVVRSTVVSLRLNGPYAFEVLVGYLTTSYTFVMILLLVYLLGGRVWWDQSLACTLLWGLVFIMTFLLCVSVHTHRRSQRLWCLRWDETTTSVRLMGWSSSPEARGGVTELSSRVVESSRVPDAAP